MGEIDWPTCIRYDVRTSRSEGLMLMHGTLHANNAQALTDAYAPAETAAPPAREDDLAFFGGLWLILPVALGIWALIIWVGVSLLS